MKANLEVEMAKGFVTTVQLRASEEKAGIGKTSGNPYKFRILSCEFAGTGKQLELTQWPPIDAAKDVAGYPVLPPLPCERGKNFSCSVSELEVVKGFPRGRIETILE